MTFRGKWLNWALGVTAVIAVILSFYASESRAPAILESAPAFLTWKIPYYNDAILNMASGYAMSVVFYFLLVLLPQRAQRRRLRHALIAIYKDMKIQIMQTILSATGQSGDEQRLVSDPAYCREFFKTGAEGRSDDRWYAVVNGVNAAMVDEIKFELQVFRDELQYVLGKVDIEEERLAELLKNLSVVLLQMGHLGNDYDAQKAWGRFLWSLYTNYSPGEGYLNSDPVLELLLQIE